MTAARLRKVFVVEPRGWRRESEPRRLKPTSLKLLRETQVVHFPLRLLLAGDAALLGFLQGDVAQENVARRNQALQFLAVNDGQMAETKFPHQV